MSIIVENGSASSTSETLCSVAYADAYHLARGCDPWFDVKMTVAKKEEALRRVVSTTIPTLVINATAELAYKAAQGNLATDLTQGVKREKVGVLEVEYDNYSVQYTRYRSIDNMLAPLLTRANGGAWKPVFRV
jgi:hypothetical protein